MDLQLSGKTALVTGASSGLGRGIAKRMALEGATVIAVARRRSKLESLREEVLAAGGAEPGIIVQDIMADDAIARICQQANELHGQVDILVNCAGASAPFTLDTPDEAWNASMLLNFTRHREISHALLPSMIANKWGRIISITMVLEPGGINGGAVAKAALNHWAKGLSRVVAEHGVTVNCIGPGRVMNGPLIDGDGIFPPDVAKKWIEETSRQIPMGRFGQPDELAVAAAFLASPLASYITGTLVAVDGGFGHSL